jgi:hypothetical protein
MISQVHDKIFSVDKGKIFMYCPFTNILQVTDNWPLYAYLISLVTVLILLKVTEAANTSLHVKLDAIARNNTFEILKKTLEQKY